MEMIRIKNLKLRTLIGFSEWELEKKQDVVLNIKIEVDTPTAEKSDLVEDCFNYKQLTKAVIHEVENYRYNLVESLAGKVANMAFDNPCVKRVWVEIDKPHALRFCDSVSYEAYRER